MTSISEQVSKWEELIKAVAKKTQKSEEVFQMNEVQKKEMAERTEDLKRSVAGEFYRVNRITGADVTLEMKEMNSKLWVTFSRADMTKSVVAPLPEKVKPGLEILSNNDVKRVPCDYWLEGEETRLNYHEIVKSLFCDDVNRVMPHLEGGSPFLHKIVKAFDKEQVPYMVSQLQKLINEVVNLMPLYETDMNAWAMNHRLVIIDPKFAFIKDPNERLQYQIDKNRKYYEKFGWTSIGLSDGVLADKNYILTTDLRRLTPFSLYHNPQRNLYSTLCMKGDELPRIRSKSMQELMDKGISRKGWNMTTAILDTPSNFEDQILVDKRHLSLSHETTKRFAIYGKKLRVKKWDKVKTGDVLGFSDDDSPVIMTLKCDEAVVSNIRHDAVDLNGESTEVLFVTITGRRFFRDGTKFSNLHGNKGIVKFVDLGYAVNPSTGEETQIDVMISGKSIEKRRNFGQIMEALYNNLNPGEDPIVVEDDFSMEKTKLEEDLEKSGFPKEGTWMISTYCGEAEAIVGKMFWGVTKDPEDASWDEGRPKVKNNRELRTSGLKFSHVELKALTTRFGPGNPIVKEIMSHSQGAEIIQDEISVLRSAIGEVDDRLPVLDSIAVPCVDSSNGIFHTLPEIKGTVVDEEYAPNGFVLKLPVKIQSLVNRKRKDLFTIGMPQEVPEENKDSVVEYKYDKIFIPNSMLRRCWKHPSGKWGLSVVGSYVNHIVSACHEYDRTKDLAEEMEIARAVSLYFINVARIMGGKRGELSVYGMSVRYPYSSRATAAQDESLPKNTIGIHWDVARSLDVKDGDVVLVERFPCLGFVSIRPQYVKVTQAPELKEVIRVSGNSLVSESLDFDGDTLFVASFHTPSAKEVLRKEMKNPNPICEAAIEKYNARKTPFFGEMTLQDFEITKFPKLTIDEQALLIKRATGVKSHTGPVIALAYNLMRIVERNVPYDDVKSHVNLELLLDFLGNTVFSQKHGVKSLQEEATDAVCTGDVEEMVRLGFDREPSEMLCELVRKEALSIGVKDLVAYHQRIKQRGGSKIINLIVRKKNRIYFATRAKLGPFDLLDNLKDSPVDLPSWMLYHALRSEREDVEEKIHRILEEERKGSKAKLQTYEMKAAYNALSGVITDMME